MSDRYAKDIVVTVTELELLKAFIEDSYIRARCDGRGYSRLPEWRMAVALLRRAEDAAIAATFS